MRPWLISHTDVFFKVETSASIIVDLFSVVMEGSELLNWSSFLTSISGTNGQGCKFGDQVRSQSIGSLLEKESGSCNVGVHLLDG
jgi:hypothetical protein